MSVPPRVSIVLPVFDGERFLPEALASCRSQTFEDWELILVDDASTDRTVEIAQRAARDDGRIRVLRHARNRRLPAALNTGFDAARGELLTWTSDDNRFLPRALEEMIGFLDAQPEVGLVYTDYRLIDPEGRTVGHRRVGPPARLAVGCAVGACFLYRRRVAEAVGPWSEGFFLAEDYEYWLRAAKVTELAPLHRELYEYRVHPECLGARRSREVFAATHRAKLRHLSELPGLDRRQRGRAYLHVARDALQLGHPWRGLAWAARALVASPRAAASFVAERLRWSDEARGDR